MIMPAREPWIDPFENVKDDTCPFGPRRTETDNESSKSALRRVDWSGPETMPGIEQSEAFERIIPPEKNKRRSTVA